jgi:hypothetical protein
MKAVVSVLCQLPNKLDLTHGPKPSVRTGAEREGSDWKMIVGDAVSVISIAP